LEPRNVIAARSWNRELKKGRAGRSRIAEEIPEVVGRAGAARLDQTSVLRAGKGPETNCRAAPDKSMAKHTVPGRIIVGFPGRHRRIRGAYRLW